MSDTKIRYPASTENYEPSNWLVQVKARLEHLKNLEPGWDGYRGQPVSKENADLAVEILKQIMPSPAAPAPQIVPGVNGDLQLEWHTHAVEIEIDILGPDNIQVWLRNEKTYPDGVEFAQNEDFTLLKNQINELIKSSGGQGANS